MVGNVLTRKSMDFLAEILSLIRPSCGLRFSAISRLEITLIRAAKRPDNAEGGFATSVKMPSTRKRMRYSFS